MMPSQVLLIVANRTSGVWQDMSRLSIPLDSRSVQPVIEWKADWCYFFIIKLFGVYQWITNRDRRNITGDCTRRHLSFQQQIHNVHLIQIQCRAISVHIDGYHARAGRKSDPRIEPNNLLGQNGNAAPIIFRPQQIDNACLCMIHAHIG